MKNLTALLIILFITINAIAQNSKPKTSGYSTVNGLSMYYEIYGEGKPLVLIHGGGSTIQTSFEKIIPYFAQHRKVIAMDLQAHGRTGDRPTPLSFAQDADDVATLLTNLKIEKADILGFSNGGQTVIEFGIRHAALANRLVICSALYNRNGAPEQFWSGFDAATIDNMPAQLQQGFLAVNNSKAALQNMFERDVFRMKHFKGWSDEQMKSINVPCLVVNGTHDVGTIEHAVAMTRLIPNAELTILPGDHGDYLESPVYFNGHWVHVAAEKSWKIF